MWPFKERLVSSVSFAEGQGQLRIGRIYLTRPKDPEFAKLLVEFVKAMLGEYKDLELIASEAPGGGKEIELVVTCYLPDGMSMEDANMEIADYFSAFQKQMGELLADGGKKFKEEVMSQFSTP